MMPIARKGEINFGEKCGCGRDVRYFVGEFGNYVGACNKYMRCLTYEELEEALKKANQLLSAYRAKREVDGLNGRTWHASRHFEVEAIIERLEEKKTK